MTTIVICEDVTATLSDRKAEQYRKAMAASERRRWAIDNVELDWHDLDDLYDEEWEAWVEFSDAWGEFFT